MKRTRIAAVLAAASLSVGALAPAAMAADSTDATVSGGTLGITTDPTVTNFGAVTLDGTAKTTTATLDAFEVNDSRGTGEGWNVTVTATQFKQHDGTNYVVDGKTLATGSLAMAAPTVAADGTTSAAPTLTAGPYDVDVASGVKVASAAVDTGMGKYDFTAGDLTLSVPASAYAHTYRSDVTVSVVTGP